uniref:neurotrophin receptor-interacting factor homolog n=1 Tax=Gasterosteus aculeatus aculeatus TaxID=481459 RepID=UPI001A9932FB
MSNRREKKKEEEEGALGAESATADPAINRMAALFESFMEVQRSRDERLEKESSKQAHQFQVLTHQVTQLQLDAEVTRERGTIPFPAALREPTPDPPSTLRGLIHLIPLLTGKARCAFVAMDPESTLDYDLLREAVLKKYEINSETYRLEFRALETSPEETPHKPYVRLRDLFSKWVKYDRSSKEGLMETMVLEQYRRVLCPEVRTWVKEHNPLTAAEAARLVENFVAAHRSSRSYLTTVESVAFRQMPETIILCS